MGLFVLRRSLNWPRSRIVKSISSVQVLPKTTHRPPSSSYFEESGSRLCRSLAPTIGGHELQLEVEVRLRILGRSRAVRGSGIQFLSAHRANLLHGARVQRLVKTVAAEHVTWEQRCVS